MVDCLNAARYGASRGLFLLVQLTHVGDQVVNLHRAQASLEWWHAVFPSLIAAANCASDWLWTWAEWRSGIFRLLPTAVSPLPSAPWHTNQVSILFSSIGMRVVRILVFQNVYCRAA